MIRPCRLHLTLVAEFFSTRAMPIEPLPMLTKTSVFVHSVMHFASPD